MGELYEHFQFMNHSQAIGKSTFSTNILKYYHKKCQLDLLAFRILN
jgi:hypothetical protein